MFGTGKRLEEFCKESPLVAGVPSDLICWFNVLEITLTFNVLRWNLATCTFIHICMYVHHPKQWRFSGSELVSHDVRGPRYGRPLCMQAIKAWPARARSCSCNRSSPGSPLELVNVTSVKRASITIGTAVAFRAGSWVLWCGQSCARMYMEYGRTHT